MIKLQTKFRVYLSLLSLCFFAVPLLLAIPGVALADDEVPSSTDSATKLVYVVPVQQTIESGLEQFLIRAFSEAEQAHADYIILRISTFGGEVEAAADIGELIRTSPVETIAYIEGKAISAGSYISLNADQIMMGPGSTIGSAAVVALDGEPVTDSKTISTWAGLMHSAAEMNDRNTDYALGMVDERQIVHVSELDKTYGAGELINFTAGEAVAAGYAEGTAKSITEVLDILDARNAHVEYVELSFAESLARFLTNPFVMPMLLLIGLVGIGIEIFVPGFGFPGALGVTAFIAYFFGQYTAGFAGVEHILLFAIGVVFLIVEIFVSSFGLFGILGIASLCGGIVLAAYDTGNAIVSLLIALLVAIVVIVIVSIYFQKRGVWNKFILRDTFTEDKGYVSTSSKKDLLGKTGIAVTTLRPSGVAEIDNKRVDVVSSGSFIRQDSRIEVIQIEGTRVVVQELSDKKP